ncbi:hypothetical protein PFISCL1PPCAC_87, partial [Pristionchus fissidentatus]
SAAHPTRSIMELDEKGIADQPTLAVDTISADLAAADAADAADVGPEGQQLADADVCAIRLDEVDQRARLARIRRLDFERVVENDLQV